MSYFPDRDLRIGDLKLDDYESLLREVKSIKEGVWSLGDKLESIQNLVPDFRRLMEGLKEAQDRLIVSPTEKEEIKDERPTDAEGSKPLV